MTQPLLYSVERIFDSPIESVWDAWVRVESLEAWYHPTDLAVVPGSVISDARVGGAWAVAVDVPQHGFVAHFFGRYTEVVEGALLEHTMHYTQSPEEFAVRDESGPSHRIVVDVDVREGGTWVRFAQFGELPEGQAELAQAGMESYFDALADFLGR